MKYKLLLIPCILLLLSSFTYAAGLDQLCYQEQANGSTVGDGNCNQDYTGNYSWVDPGNFGFASRMADGDFDTFGTFAIGDNQNFSINYSKPNATLSSIIWTVKYATDAGFNKTNMTLNQTCEDQNPIQLQVTGRAATPHLNFTCWNGTAFTVLDSFTGGNSNVFYEEAITWVLQDITDLNLIIRDETSNQLILGETFSTNLQKTGFSQSDSFADNPHLIIGLGIGIYTQLKISSTNYLERQYLDLDLTGIGSQVNKTIYLLNSTLGSEITFNIVDEGLNPLSDVKTVFTKVINGSDELIAEEISDFAGQVVLTLNSDTQYTINFTRADYEDQQIKLEPKKSEYVIQMVRSVGKYNQSVHEGIRYSFSPINEVLNNNTNFNFTFTLNSSVWPLTNCTLFLKNGSQILNQTSSFTSNSCFLSIEQNTGNMSNITSEAVYELDSQFNFTVIQQYRVIFTYEGQFSLKNFLDDLSEFGGAGFDSFGRMILAIIIIFIITALAAREITGFTSFTNPEILILLVIAQVWFFSFVGWFFLDFAPIPTIAGFDLKKYIIAILVTLSGGAFIIEKFSK